jgi:hypothetical protein
MMEQAGALRQAEITLHFLDQIDAAGWVGCHEQRAAMRKWAEQALAAQPANTVPGAVVSTWGASETLTVLPTCTTCGHKESLHRSERGGYCIHAECRCKSFAAQPANTVPGAGDGPYGDGSIGRARDAAQPRDPVDPAPGTQVREAPSSPLKCCCSPIHSPKCPLCDSRSNSTSTTPGKLAQRFHELYEYLAPSFGYETRKASAKPWAEVPENNRKLMTTVCEHILKELELPADTASAALDQAQQLIKDAGLCSCGECWTELAKKIAILLERAAPGTRESAALPINAVMVEQLLHESKYIYKDDSPAAYEWLAKQLNRNVISAQSCEAANQRPLEPGNVEAERRSPDLLASGEPAHASAVERISGQLGALGTREREASAALREAAQGVIDWEQEYRTLNHLGKNPPHAFALLAVALASPCESHPDLDVLMKATLAMRNGFREIIQRCKKWKKQYAGTRGLSGAEIHFEAIIGLCERSLNDVPAPGPREQELHDLLQNVIDSAVTDADTCAICLQDLKKHASGCSVDLAVAALAGGAKPVGEQ